MYQILIADDELIERTVLFKTLQKNYGDQCSIYKAANGREALELFREKEIHIAILDIEMPGINGLEAAVEMRKWKPECIILFLTAFDDFAYAKKAISVRALDYLLKPYQDDELFAVIEEALRLAKKARKATAAPETEKEYQDEGGQERLIMVAKNMKTYVQNHYANDISLQDAARAMNYSDAYFCKLFKQCFDKNFTSYLTEYRIEEAKKLLARPTSNVKEIGDAVGYPDSNYFAKVFKRITGFSPSEYRLEQRNRKG